MNSQDSLKLTESEATEHFTRWEALIDCYCEGCEDDMQATETEFNTAEHSGELLLCVHCRGEDVEPLETDKDFWEDRTEETQQENPKDIYTDINITGVNNGTKN